MLGIFAWPKAESVVVLRCEDQSLEVGILNDLDQCVGIEIRRVEQLGRLVTIAPLLIGECVDCKMHKCVLLHLVPLYLAW